MKVELLHATPIEILDTALTKCWGSECKSGDAMMERIDRIINKNKHGSIAEHCQVNIDVEGVSRALLQEVARHRISSISVKSTRYVINKMKVTKPCFDASGGLSDEIIEFAKENCVYPVGLSDTEYFIMVMNSASCLGNMIESIKRGLPNDKAKYYLPENIKTSFTWTLNIRSLMNLLELRTDKSALWEFQQLAHEVFNVLPEPYKYLLKNYVKNE